MMARLKAAAGIHFSSFKDPAEGKIDPKVRDEAAEDMPDFDDGPRPERPLPAMVAMWNKQAAASTEAT